MTERFFLRPDLLVEPLINHWVAWDQLIPPATAAMVVKNSQIEIMRSYLADPRMHLQAANDPELMGGPWLNHPAERADEVRALLTRTQTGQATLLELAGALKQLDALLRQEAKGGSLEPLYCRVPEALRGYVELVYDINNHPSIRIMEALLYRSPAYDRNQQCLALSRITSDRRPFQWSTPILPDGQRVFASLPFDAPQVDSFFATTTNPRPLEEIGELLGLTRSELPGMRRFVTPEPALARGTFDGPGLRVRYLGHACLLLQTRGVSILTDPFLSYEYPAAMKRFTQLDLPERIDYAIISHAHNDHIDFETLLRLRHRIGCLVVPANGGGKVHDPSLKLLLRQIGFQNVVALEELEAIEFDGGAIMSVPFLGEHCDLDIQTKRGYLIRAADKVVYCGADSRNVEPRLYSHLHDLYGDIDLLFLGMECEGAPLSWAYGALLTQPLERKLDLSRTVSGSDADQALSITDALKPKQAYVYAMGQEPWLNHVMAMNHNPISRRVTEPQRFIEACRSRGMVADQPYGRLELHLP